MVDGPRIERFEVLDAHHGSLPALVLAPAEVGHDVPVCSFLYGGGGSAETLLSLEPLLRQAWQERSVPSLLVACLGVPPFCFYLDAPAHGMFWQQAVGPGLLRAVREHFADEASKTRAGLVGVSMGGYGALKIAFSEPRRFSAVAAVAPMLEPSEHSESVPLRNRCHYPDTVPSILLGPQRDVSLFAADHPISRARRNAAEIRGADLAIRIDAGSRDALNAHDGAEALHRELWQLTFPTSIISCATPIMWARRWHLACSRRFVGLACTRRALRTCSVRRNARCASIWRRCMRRPARSTLLCREPTADCE